MFNIFKKKCPVYRMTLVKDKEYPERYGKKFCSKNCKEEFSKKMAREQLKPRGGCCH